jgi:hypothetical protein
MAGVAQNVLREDWFSRAEVSCQHHCLQPSMISPGAVHRLCYRTGYAMSSCYLTSFFVCGFLQRSICQLPGWNKGVNHAGSRKMMCQIHCLKS